MLKRNFFLILMLGGAVAIAGAAQNGTTDSASPQGHVATASKLAVQPKQARPAAVVAPAPVLPAAPSTPLPGMPPVIDPQDIYTADRPNQLSPAVRNFPPRIYVPNSESNSVDVIDPTSLKIIDHFDVGRQPQHIVVSYDLKTLWVLDDKGNALTRIDPATGKKGETVPVDDPYNLYFTPDGENAIVVAESLHRLDFRDPHTMSLKYSLTVPCSGVNHMDFSADGRFLVASCEYDGKMLKVDVPSRTVLATMRFGGHSMPQDVRLSPDGKIFYVADMAMNGVHEVDAANFTQLGFLQTGKGTHGLYVSRDSKFLYISNRGEGSISVLDFQKQAVVKKWRIPNGGSPDMGGISADGGMLWLAGRYNSEIYGFETATGKLVARIPVGKGPHGLCVYPQPGRYSMGHTGIFR
jgi:YVTN family beta-propeller protein